MGLYLNPNADAPDGCAGPFYTFRLTNLKPGIGYRVRVSSATGGGHYCTRCRSKADSAFYTSELDGLLEEGLGITGTGLFKEETDDMRYLQSLYRQERGDSIDNTAAYIFILPKASVDGVKGDMPLTRPVGYVFASGDTYADGQTIAHELGHGLYSFQHAFDYMGVSQGETDNLMDYGLPQGEKLAVWQWNLISTHKNYTIPFLTDDEDGWKKINGFSVQISEPAGYDGRNYIYDDGGCKDYTAAEQANESELKKCYQKFNDEYIPLILVARGRTAKFTLHLSHYGDIKDNDKQYDFMVEEAESTNGVVFKKKEFKMSDLNKGTIDIEFSIEKNDYPKITDPDTKKFILVKDYKENILAKVQYLSLVPKPAKYKLVYLADKNNNVRKDYIPEVFNKTLNDFHGSLFLEWKCTEIDTFKEEDNLKYVINNDDSRKLILYLTINYYRHKDTEIDSTYRQYYELGKSLNNDDDKAATDFAMKKLYNKYSEKFKQEKLCIVTKFDFGTTGGATFKYYGTACIWKATGYNDINVVGVHEFAHLFNVPDLVCLPTNKSHPDRKYCLVSEKVYDNFMYYLDANKEKLVKRKRWFLHQVKRVCTDYSKFYDKGK